MSETVTHTSPDSHELRQAPSERREKLADAIEIRRITPEDTELWDAIGRLRKQVYVDERGYLTPDVLDEEGREYDEFDTYDDTVHIRAVDEKGEVVGYVRILTKGPNGTRVLPSEEAFEEQLKEKNMHFGDNVTEISRLIVKHPKLTVSPVVTASLVRAIAHELNAEDKYSATTIATLEPFLERYLRDMIGVPVDEYVGLTYVPEYKSKNKLVGMWPAGIVERATELDESGRKSVVLPDRMGPFFADMKRSRGLGKIAISELREDSNA